MPENNNISRDKFIQEISTYCEPEEGETLCVPHIVESTLLYLETIGVDLPCETAEEALEGARKTFQRIAKPLKKELGA